MANRSNKKKKMHPALMITLGAVGLFILIGIIAVAFGPEDDEKPKETMHQDDSIIVVSAARVYYDYSQNEVAADKKYKGKRIRVTGIVNSIAKDILKDAFVTLQAGEFGEVQCYFDDESQLISLKKGQEIIIHGLGDGMAIINPIIRKCRLQ
jgi:hypothetical protein